ncbi:MAG TPA: ComEC/Rec2 family competence protein [Clostridiales bacterium]|nr:ComEC/Rec2 family competence protein [Clostridiales bacterium]
MKKIINFRLLFFLSVAIGALILGICEMFRHNYLWASLSLSAFCVMVVIISLFQGRRVNIIITLVLSLICLGSTLYTLYFWEGKDQKGQIVLTLTDQITQDQKTLFAIGKDIEINGKKTKGKAQIFVELDDQSYLYGLRAGDKVMVYSGDLTALKLDNLDYLNSQNYHENIKYVIRCQEFDIRRYSGESDILSGFRYKLKDIIFKNISDSDAASISYAMITGNRDYISTDIYQSYKTAGLAHILAVSGMNISFLIICISILFFGVKRFRISKLIIMIAFIGFYCALCCFAPSVVRAAIMGIIMIVSKTFGQRLDSLNSLGFASILMLVFKPLYIYELSFLLSFASVFSIVCLYSPFVKLFKKILRGKQGAKIAQLCAMTLSANIGVYPLIAHFFNTFSVYSLIANLILLPLINIAFVVLFAVCLIILIIPFLAFLMAPVGWLLALINALTRLISSLPYAELIVFSLGGLAVFYFICVFIWGGYINISKKPKAAVSLILALFFAVSVTVTNLPSVYAQDFYMAYDSAIGEVGLVIEDNLKYVIGQINKYNYAKIKKELINQKIRKIDCLIITSKPYDAQALIDFGEDFSINKIALITDDWALCDEIKIKSRKDVIQIFDNINYKINDLEIYSYSYNNIRLGSHILVNGKKILYPLNLDKDKLEILNTLSVGCDVLVCNKYIENIDYMLYLIYDCDNADPNIIKLSQINNYTFSL